MITKKLKKAGDDLYFICFNCKENTYIRNIVPILGNEEDMEKVQRLQKTSQTAPLGTGKTFLFSLLLSLATAIFVGDILDMPPFLIIFCFGFVFEFIINPILLHFWGKHKTIWVHYCENCNMKWQVVAISNKTMLLVFRFLF